MKNTLIISFLFCLIQNTIAFSQTESDSVDVRGMTLKERLALKNKFSAERRNAQIPIEKQSEDFFSVMKEKGAAGVSELRKSVRGLDQSMIDREKGVQHDDPFARLETSLSAKDGEVKNVRQISMKETGNGNQKRIEYLVEHKNGKTEIVELLYLKPTISGGFKLMEVKVKD